MELIYIWIDKYRTFEKTGINLSDKFHVEYDGENSKIIIEKNSEYVKLYPYYIENISVILGKNATGKSNLLDLIGTRVEDRNKNDEEWEHIYRNKSDELDILKKNKIINKIKKSHYFLIYYVGIGENERDIFCFEGDDIGLYENILNNKEKMKQRIDINYYKGKYWFSFICTYDNKEKKFNYINYISGDGGFKINSHKYSKTTKDKNVIILFSDEFRKNIDDNSSKPNDESKIAMARRVAIFNSRLVYKKIKFLINQITLNSRHENKKSSMYKDISYKLNIIYKDYDNFEEYSIIEYKDITMNLSVKENIILKIISRFCCHFATSIMRDLNDIDKKNCLKHINSNMDTYDGAKQYYILILKEILKINKNSFEKYYHDPNDDKYFLESYDNLIKTLEEVLSNDDKNEKLDIETKSNSLIVNINKDTNISILEELLKATVDERTEVSVNDYPYSLFVNFFSWSIENLSDGELAYLNIMSAIDEQISIMTQIKSSVEKKENYILLLDEPEISMHPELARNFINEIINLLAQYNKKFQIIIASHSPFLVSDIPKNNVICLEREKGLSVVKQCEFNTFAQNIHTLYKNNFFMNSTMGEYSNKKIKEISKTLDNFDEKIKNGATLNKNDIENVSQELSTIQKIIDMIGENIIRQALQDKLNKVNAKLYDKSFIELNNLKMEYSKLSNDEKKNFIDYIINSSSME